MASIHVYDIDSTSFTVMLIDLQTSGVNYTRKCSWTALENSSGNYMASGNSYITAGETEGGDYTFTRMSPDTEYYISCQVTRTDTNAHLATLSIVVTTSSGGGGGGSGGGDDTEPTWDYEYNSFVVGDSFKQSLYIPQYTTLIYSISFENDGVFEFYASGDCVASGFLLNRISFDETSGRPLNYGLLNSNDKGYDNFYFAHQVYAGNTYYLYVKHYDGESEGKVTLHIEPYDGLVIERWRWDETTTREIAYDAVMNRGATTDFNHRVWDDLVDKVAKIVEECGYWWDDSYGDYDNTKSKRNSKGEYVLTASMFNSIRNNIEIIGRYRIGTDIIDSTLDHNNAPKGTIPHPVESGRKVFGHYFNTLAAYINKCIDLLTDYGIEQ